MVWIGQCAEASASDDVRIIRLAFQSGGDLAHHPLVGFRVETRFGNGELQKREGAGRIPRQALQASGQNVAVGGKRHFDRILGKGAMKSIRVIRSSPFVEEARKKRGGAGLADRILRGAALENEFEGDEGNRVFLDEPSLNGAFGEDLLDSRRA